MSNGFQDLGRALQGRRIEANQQAAAAQQAQTNALLTELVFEQQIAGWSEPQKQQARQERYDQYQAQLAAQEQERRQKNWKSLIHFVILIVFSLFFFLFFKE